MNMSFFFPFFGCTHEMWKFPGQGSNPSWRYNLCHNCINPGSSTHCTGPGIKPAPPQRQEELPMSSYLHVHFLTYKFFFSLGPPPWHTEVPGLGAKQELQLQAYTTATARQDLSHICKLCCSLRQHQILNPLSKTRDQTRILVITSWAFNLLSHNRNSYKMGLMPVPILLSSAEN